MEIIISKAFLQNFYENFDAENDYYSDFEKFLRRNICNDFVLITDFTEQELYSSLTWTQYPILKDIEQKSAHTEFETQLLDKVEQIAFYQQSSAFKLFCIEKSDADCEKLKENFGFLYLNSTNIDSEWRVFYSERQDDSMPIDNISNPRFDNWQKIDAYKHPINSLLIFDKYMFVDNSRTGFINDNLYECLRHLLNDKLQNIPLEIIFMTNAKEIGRGSRNTYSNRKMNIIHQELCNFFRNDFSHLNVKISIVNFHYKESQSVYEKEHDRGIYTNYCFIEIGAGINLFRQNGEIINRSTIHFYNLFTQKGKNMGFSGLRNFKKYINEQLLHSHNNRNFCQFTASRLLNSI